MVIDADKWRLALVDHRREAAEAAQVPDVETGDDVGALDFLHGVIARVGAFGDHETETFGNAGGIGDAD